MSGNQLAKRMEISRQAVYDRLTGRNTTLDWIARAARCLGAEIRVSFVEKKKAA